jgi:hypothetical protein
MTIAGKKTGGARLTDQDPAGVIRSLFTDR